MTRRHEQHFIFYTATVCGYCAYSFFTNSERNVKHARLKICCRARPTDQFRYGRTWIGIVQQLKMTFSVHINMEVEVSLFSSQNTDFLWILPKLFSCISTHPKRDPWTCEGTLASCVCVRSVTLAAPDSVIQGKRISFGWMASVFPGRDLRDYSHNQSCETTAAAPDQMCQRGPGTCCRAEVGVECEGLLISNQSRKPPASGGWR